MMKGDKIMQVAFQCRENSCMVTTPIQKLPTVPPIEAIEQQFRRLESQWAPIRWFYPTPARLWAILPCGPSLQW